MTIYKVVRDSGLPNYLQARIPLPSDLRCDAWQALLANYDDNEIVDFLRFGWPSSYTAPTPPTTSNTNHPSAQAFSKDIDSFIHKELSKQALLGPFTDLPFLPWTQTSPIMTVPKPGSSKRRVIIDLSFPKGESVNDGVAKNFFQGRDLSYSLPSAADLSQCLLFHGRSCFMWKADLERAYRQLRSDPLDYPLMGIRHNGSIYVDVCPSFGARGSSAAQQRVSRAVSHLMVKAGHHCLAYMDDFCGAAASFDEAVAAFVEFERLTAQLGLKLAPDKCAFPAKAMDWLGFYFDASDLSVTIPPDKLKEVTDLSRSWLFKKRATRHDLQVLTGKLMFISHCVLPARKFMSRILSALRSSPQKGSIYVSCELRRDVRWFVDFASACNAKLLLVPDMPLFHIECDACLDGAGGFSETQYYSFRFPPAEKRSRHISQLEATNIVVAVKSLIPPTLANHKVVVTTDNLASVYALNSGRTSDYVLAACSRELWLVAATRQLSVLIQHAPGVSLVLADALSRRYMDSKAEAIARQLIGEKGLVRVDPVPLDYVITNHL